MKGKAKALDLIEWVDSKTGIRLFGRVRKILSNSVIADVIGLDDATVVSHKRYRVIQEGEIDGTTAEQFQRACRAMGNRKWF